MEIYAYQVLLHVGKQICSLPHNSFEKVFPPLLVTSSLDHLIKVSPNITYIIGLPFKSVSKGFGMKFFSRVERFYQISQNATGAACQIKTVRSI